MTKKIKQNKKISMKIKLLLLAGFSFVPFWVAAQTTFLYNKGLMTINGAGKNDDTVETDISATTLYIGGDFIVGGGSDSYGNTTISQIHLKGSKTVLTGDFIHDINLVSRNSTPTVYSQIFYMPTGIFYESTGASYYRLNSSRFVFRGTKAQSIRLADGLVYGLNPIYAKTYSTTYKGLNYIDFPDIVIENSNHVTIVPELAVRARNLVLNTGRLIVDSRRAISTDFSGVVTYSNLHTPSTSTMMAHFMMYEPFYNPTSLVTNKIITPNNPTYAFFGGSNQQFGAVQVNLAVNDPAIENAGEKTGRSLIAMGSPYEEMSADYFFWNFLMTPTGENIIGGVPAANGNTMTDPKYKLTAGKAFVIGVDLRGTNSENYKDIHDTYKNKGVSFDHRGGAGVTEDELASANKGKYFFSRYGPFFSRSTNVYPAAGYAQINFLPVVNIRTETAYTKEILNHSNVPINLVNGYNYFSNPFTVPFDLSDFVTSPNGTLLPSVWGSSLKIGDANITDRVFTNKIWVLDPTSKGSGTYDIGSGINPGNKLVNINTKYRVMKRVGSTATGNYDPGTDLTSDINPVIAPLQMFVLYAKNGAGKVLTLPLSKRKIDSNALFLRSASAASEFKLKDDFLFEVHDVETNTSDRVAIVIRTPQEVLTDGEYAPTKKMLSLISIDENSTTSVEMEGGTIKQTPMSTLYTRDDEGNALESNVLGVPESSTTESVVLYLTPSSIDQDITLTAGRLTSKERVASIILIDKVANKEFDLTSGNSYQTTSKANDPLDRFTLRFTFNTLGIEGEENKQNSNDIISYYTDGVLTVEGFEDADFGSLISVYDLQGRRVAQTKVTETSEKIAESFSTGAYIVKVVGKKSYATKFLVK